MWTQESGAVTTLLADRRRVYYSAVQYDYVQYSLALSCAQICTVCRAVHVQLYIVQCNGEQCNRAGQMVVVP